MLAPDGRDAGYTACAVLSNSLRAKRASGRFSQSNFTRGGRTAFGWHRIVSGNPDTV